MHVCNNVLTIKFLCYQNENIHNCSGAELSQGPENVTMKNYDVVVDPALYQVSQPDTTVENNIQYEGRVDVATFSGSSVESGEQLNVNNQVTEHYNNLPKQYGNSQPFINETSTFGFQDVYQPMQPFAPMDCVGQEAGYAEPGPSSGSPLQADEQPQADPKGKGKAKAIAGDTDSEYENGTCDEEAFDESNDDHHDKGKGRAEFPKPLVVAEARKVGNTRIKSRRRNTVPKEVPPGFRRCSRCRQIKRLGQFRLTYKTCNACIDYCRSVTRRKPGTRSGTRRPRRQRPDLAPLNPDDGYVQAQASSAQASSSGTSSSDSAAAADTGEQTASEGTRNKGKRKVTFQTETSEDGHDDATAQGAEGSREIIGCSNGRGKPADGDTTASASASTSISDDGSLFVSNAVYDAEMGGADTGGSVGDGERGSAVAGGSAGDAEMGSADTGGSAGDTEMVDAYEVGGPVGGGVDSNAAEYEARDAIPRAPLDQYAVRGPLVLPPLRAPYFPPPKTHAQRFDAMFPRGTGESV